MRWLFIENEVREVTQPGDTYECWEPTGRKRAWLFGVRVPVRAVFFVLRAIGLIDRRHA